MSKKGGGINKLIDDYTKRHGQPPVVPIVQSMLNTFSKFSVRTIRTPPDAATARMPEAESPKLFVPPEHEIQNLIAQARTLEDEASRLVESGGPRELIDWNNNAALRSRVKAICLHLGIEKVR